MTFVGILLLLGHRRQSRQQLFWNLDSNLDSPLVREAMRKESKENAKCAKKMQKNNALHAMPVFT